MKEIRLRPNIGAHDLDTKLRSVRRLLRKDKVRVSVHMRGREASNTQPAFDLMDRVLDDLKGEVRTGAPQHQGRVIWVDLTVDPKYRATVAQ